MGLDMYLEDKETATELGYWRKANQIHKWFVDNVEQKADDCRRYDVSRADLIKLKTTCLEVIDKSKMVEGNVPTHQSLKDGKWEQHYKKGLIVEDPTVALELLPPSSGFFFGSHTIDENYMYDLKETVIIIDKCLELDDYVEFAYQSSW